MSKKCVKTLPNGYNLKKIGFKNECPCVLRLMPMCPHVQVFNGKFIMHSSSFKLKGSQHGQESSMDKYSYATRHARVS